MFGRSELWNLIEPIAAELGLELFDIDLPSGRNGILRVYISRPKQEDGLANSSSESEESSQQDAEKDNQAGVSLGDCTAVSKKIAALPELGEGVLDSFTLEVSSPGVNRRLRSKEHFEGAIGEHVMVKFSGSDNKNKKVKGTLIAFDGESVTLEIDGSSAPLVVPFEDIKESRVDFLFQ